VFIVSEMHGYTNFKLPCLVIRVEEITAAGLQHVSGCETEWAVLSDEIRIIDILHISVKPN